MATTRTEAIRGLYAVTPDEPDTQRLCALVEAAVRGGARLVQYRNKTAPEALRREQAAALLAICRRYGVPLIVNDHLELALAIGADGLHLGRDDGNPAEARARLPDAIIGVSCYDEIARAEAARAAGADYVAFGRFFPSTTKPGNIRASLELVAEAKRRVGLPVVGIGGITLENAPSLVRGGVDALAVVSALFDSPDVEATARRFADLYERPGSSSEALFERAQRLIPGGVNSPVRAFRAVGGTPPFIARAQGAWVEDVEGRRYIDYVGSWGPMILGHAHPEIVAAVQAAAARGLSFGAPTQAEVELAETLCTLVPGLEQVRLVSSGTEACMSAIRLARGFTGRDVIVKFDGCYHGHADSLLVKAGSGALTFGQPSSAGVPADLARHTLVLPYNDVAAVRDAFACSGERIAAVMVEPVAGNMNLVAPAEGFLATLRELTSRHGAVLILDEVMTGFRVGLKGAAGLYGITPDLLTLGKVVGGGMPLAAFGGRRDIMACLAPLGPVYQAGTLSGNPLAVAAGLATLRLVQTEGFYERLSALARRLTEGLTRMAREAGVAFSAQSVGGMFGIYFRESLPSNLEEVMASDVKAFNRFFHAMLTEGVYLAPSAFEAGFVSAAHAETDIERTLEAARRAFRAARAG